MKLYKFILWLCLLLALVDIAYSQEKATILIDRNRYMRRAVASSVVTEAVKKLPVKLSYRLRVSPRNQCSKLPTDGGVQFDCYKKVRSNIRGRVLFLSEPTIINDVIYTEGRAQVCIPFATGVCNITEKNQENKNRIAHAIVACAHELGHMFGARPHDVLFNGCPTIMYYAPFPYVDFCQMEFSLRSAFQISWCLR